MIKLQQHHSDQTRRSATVWHSLAKWEYYVEIDESGRLDKKFFLENEAEDYAEDYVLGEDVY